MMFLGRLFDTIAWLVALVVGAVGSFVMLVSAYATADTRSAATGLVFLGLLLLAILKLLHWSARRHAAAAADPQATFVLTYSAVSLVLIVAVFLLLAAACAIGLLSATSEMWRWGLAAGSAASVVMAVCLFVRGRAISLTLSPDGLDFSQFRCGLIPWRDIASVDVRTIARATAVVIELRNEETYLERRRKPVPWAFRWWISEQVLDVPPVWLWKAIQIRLACFGGPAVISGATR